jgi:hypothetical protein
LCPVAAKRWTRKRIRDGIDLREQYTGKEKQESGKYYSHGLGIKAPTYGPEDDTLQVGL